MLTDSYLTSPQYTFNVIVSNSVPVLATIPVSPFNVPRSVPMIYTLPAITDLDGHVVTVQYY